MTADTAMMRAPAECVVKIDGAEISTFYRFLREVQVQMSRSAPATGTMIFDTVRGENGSWSVQDVNMFRPWKQIEIAARFGSQSEKVMTGLIREVKVDCPEDMSAAAVTVTVQDETLLLDREYLQLNLSSASAPQTDGEIAGQIAARYNLRAVTATGLSNTNLNSDRTAINLLQDRARANGFEFFVRDGTLYFQPPQLQGQPQSTIMVYAGRATNCLRFSTRFDGHKPDQIQVIRAAERGTDIDDQTLSSDLHLLGTRAVTSDDQGLLPFVWTLRSPNGATGAETTARAQASANENAWKLIAEGELDGTLYGHVLKTHETVRVDGVGDTYGGVYYVDEVRHVFNMDGYRQTFKLLRNAVGDQPAGQSDVLAPMRS